ncbi:hypothetical protein COX64_03625 [Candidatus Dojkabacteria bacterium CG_4_10_14_0_2_um_filter_Dojkabacteria_WS6_41_15]|uniref:Uncharacterized protein n=1 Tax=Candidatus Dojkabacteria bacterium CG_4_10_14_0_2_um_filter_Dojkabacteria_WS6_41_15 TaxID=2014249 RepID=A0A2M7W1B7_9BACT|nr:MAG: hypothetical protein COX64_03625 [Candidatus Dojkabacteria bacterium CG_4_10_14_0_2_um_filter_Dojkabacteria_WS6_41_15]
MQTPVDEIHDAKDIRVGALKQGDTVRIMTHVLGESTERAIDYVCMLPKDGNRVLFLSKEVQFEGDRYLAIGMSKSSARLLTVERAFNGMDGIHHIVSLNESGLHGQKITQGRGSQRSDKLEEFSPLEKSTVLEYLVPRTEQFMDLPFLKSFLPGVYNYVKGDHYCVKTSQTEAINWNKAVVPRALMVGPNNHLYCLVTVETLSGPVDRANVGYYYVLVELGQNEAERNMSVRDLSGHGTSQSLKLAHSLEESRKRYQVNQQGLHTDLAFIGLMKGGRLASVELNRDFTPIDCLFKSENEVTYMDEPDVEGRK